MTVGDLVRADVVAAEGVDLDAKEPVVTGTETQPATGTCPTR